MSDLRIKKTKAKLAEALIELLQQDSFEHISVTDLCKTSGVSRITFYAYYDDKFELAAELFEEMRRTAEVIFGSLQKENNPGDDPAAGCLNLLDAVLDMQEQYHNISQRLLTEENAYLSFSYYQHVLRSTEERSRRYVEELSPIHPLQMTTGMICTGIWGFMRAGLQEQRRWGALRPAAETLLKGFLNDPVLFRRPAAVSGSAPEAEPSPIQTGKEDLNV